MTLPGGEAEYLLSNQLLKQIFDDLERSAIEAAVNAKSSNDELRATSLQEVRAIRAVRRELQSLAKGKTNPKPRGPVA